MNSASVKLQMVERRDKNKNGNINIDSGIT